MFFKNKLSETVRSSKGTLAAFAAVAALTLGGCSTKNDTPSVRPDSALASKESPESLARQESVFSRIGSWIGDKVESLTSDKNDSSAAKIAEAMDRSKEYTSNLEQPESPLDSLDATEESVEYIHKDICEQVDNIMIDSIDTATQAPDLTAFIKKHTELRKVEQAKLSEKMVYSTLSDIKRRNMSGISHPDELQAEYNEEQQEKGKEISAANPVYTVVSGDTLSFIAEKYRAETGLSISYYDIIQANKLTSNIIFPGDQFIIPVNEKQNLAEPFAYDGSMDSYVKEDFKATIDAIDTYNQLNPETPVTKELAIMDAFDAIPENFFGSVKETLEKERKIEIGHPGGKDLVELAQVLAHYDYLDQDPSFYGENSFDEALQTAVKLYQKLHRLNADGVVGFQQTYPSMYKNYIMEASSEFPENLSQEEFVTYTYLVINEYSKRTSKPMMGTYGQYTLKELAETIYTKSKEGNKNPLAMLALIKNESSFNPTLVSHVGAVGLLQLMPDTAKEVGLTLEERRDSKKNIEAGITYFTKNLTSHLDWSVRQYKKVQKTDFLTDSIQARINAYNGGAGSTAKWGAKKYFGKMVFRQFPKKSEPRGLVRKTTNTFVHTYKGTEQYLAANNIDRSAPHLQSQDVLLAQADITPEKLEAQVSIESDIVASNNENYSRQAPIVEEQKTSNAILVSQNNIPVEGEQGEVKQEPVEVAVSSQSIDPVDQSTVSNNPEFDTPVEKVAVATLDSNTQQEVQLTEKQQQTKLALEEMIGVSGIDYKEMKHLAVLNKKIRSNKGLWTQEAMTLADEEMVDMDTRITGFMTELQLMKQKYEADTVQHEELQSSILKYTQLDLSYGTEKRQIIEEKKNLQLSFQSGESMDEDIYAEDIMVLDQKLLFLEEEQSGFREASSQLQDKKIALGQDLALQRQSISIKRKDMMALMTEKQDFITEKESFVNNYIAAQKKSVKQEIYAYIDSLKNKYKQTA
ncbi:MAG: transglycosylase SLT domain-containing protein [Patescibacteria group bacterium]|nr:transglycosylase SLT domain-containing protein [Patescibacteria group bacterium]